MDMPTKTPFASRWDRIRDIGSQVFNALDSFVVRAPKITLLFTKTPIRTASLPAVVPASRATAQDQFRRLRLSLSLPASTPFPATDALRSTFARAQSGEATQKATGHGDAGRLLRRRSSEVTGDVDAGRLLRRRSSEVTGDGDAGRLLRRRSSAATGHVDAGRLLRRRSSDAGNETGTGSRMLAEMRWEEAWLKLAEVKVAAPSPTEHKSFARRPSLHASGGIRRRASVSGSAGEGQDAASAVGRGLVRSPTKWLAPVKPSMPLRTSSSSSMDMSA
ncbi:hypothetical protein T484DRAFT_1965614 [Baffinella frigidus]|nr:hypothetical protein T484DRAFT_1965614 [Cryptophyta sp. CCMP2293]